MGQKFLKYVRIVLWRIGAYGERKLKAALVGKRQKSNKISSKLSDKSLSNSNLRALSVFDVKSWAMQSATKTLFFLKLYTDTKN